MRTPGRPPARASVALRHTSARPRRSTSTHSMRTRGVNLTAQTTARRSSMFPRPRSAPQRIPMTQAPWYTPTHRDARPTSIQTPRVPACPRWLAPLQIPPNRPWATVSSSRPRTPSRICSRFLSSTHLRIATARRQRCAPAAWSSTRDMAWPTRRPLRSCPSATTPSRLPMTVATHGRKQRKKHARSFP